MKRKSTILLSLLLTLTAVFSMPTLSSCDDGVEISFATATAEEIEPITRKVGDLYGKLPVPTREGYTFLGWKTEKMGGEYARRSVKVEKDIDHTLYAKWRKDEEEITFPLEVKKERLDIDGSASFYIDANGKLYAWGNNASGQLGDGTIETRLSPVAVLTDKKWAQVDGDAHARIYGIDEEGALWSWGSRREIPTPGKDEEICLIPERIMPNKKFCAIEAGWGEYRHFALALDVNGGLWAWGDNYYGQLGQGGESGGVTEPWTDSGNDTPVRIKKDVRFVEISTNGETCGAIDEEGKLWLWGDNANGELANGKVYDGNDLSTSMSWLSSSTPTVAIETEGIRFSKVYCMKLNTFAIDYEGNIWGCGEDDYFGTLGNAENADSSVFIQITSEVRFKGVWSASPSVALDEYGDLWWWGYDSAEFVHQVDCLRNHSHENRCEGACSPIPIEMDFYSDSSLNIESFCKLNYRIYILTENNEVWGWSNLEIPPTQTMYLGDGTTELRDMENMVRIF